MSTSFFGYNSIWLLNPPNFTLVSLFERFFLLSATLHVYVPYVPHTIRQCFPTVVGQNGSGQNGTDKMVWTKWYTCMDKMSLDKMAWTKWYGQNGTNKTVPIKSSLINLSIPLPLTIRFFHDSRFHFDPFTFPLCA